MNNNLLVVAVLLFVLIFIFWPFVLIWSLNILFPTLMIPYNFWTWLATLLLTMTFSPKPNVKS